MILSRVVGNVVSTVKHGFLHGHKLMIVQPVCPDGKPKGKSMIAIDTVQSGIGDTVLVLDEGNSARTIVGDKMAPVRTVVVGIVDNIEWELLRKQG
ncbi:MAG: EutN/CcmL family microcompartment protein [Spirochaetota bacterium]